MTDAERLRNLTERPDELAALVADHSSADAARRTLAASMRAELAAVEDALGHLRAAVALGDFGAFRRAGASLTLHSWQSIDLGAAAVKVAQARAAVERRTFAELARAGVE